MLTIKNVQKSYQTPEGPLPVLRGIDLELAAGESLALTGESGSGKSTLLHAVAGLEPIDGGEISVAGKIVSAMGDRQAAAFRLDQVGIVFQQFNLVPSLSIEQNVRLQARLAGREDKGWIEHLELALGIAELRARYPEQLSGGQQQRAAIARALAPRPDLVLADEPTGNLDSETGDMVMDVFLQMIRDSGCGFVMVTHNARLAEMLQRNVRLVAGQLT